MVQFIKAVSTVLAMITALSLVGCNSNEFSAYDHFTEIVTHISSDTYEPIREYILTHTSPDLQTIIDANMSGDVLYPEYRIKEVSHDISRDNNTVHMILEYRVTGTVNETLVAYATYVNDILTDYNVYTFEDENH